MRSFGGSCEDRHDDTGEAALTFGLVTGAAAVIAAMGQIQRGANRIYSVHRDRPAARKYVRAAVLALTAGVPAVAGFLLIVAGRAVGESLQNVYGWESLAAMLWTVLHLPVAAVLTLGGIVVLFQYVPRRRQPSLPWLLPGVLLSVLAWIGLSALLAAYVNSGLAFSDIYGPLAGVMALLVRANASGVALFLGFACCAQLAVYRADQPCPVGADASGSAVTDQQC